MDNGQPLDNMSTCIGKDMRIGDSDRLTAQEALGGGCWFTGWLWNRSSLAGAGIVGSLSLPIFCMNNVSRRNVA